MSASLATPHARFVDPTRAGSGWSQVGVGALAVVLALILVVGQVALATTRDIAASVHRTAANLEQGNVTMAKVIASTSRNAELQRLTDQQQVTLHHTGQAMRALNTTVASTSTSAAGLARTTRDLRDTSARIDTSLGQMARDASTIATEVGPLPGTAKHLSTTLAAANRDTQAIAGELQAVAQKLAGYGLPVAQGTPG